MRVRRILGAHCLDRGGERAGSVENVSVLRKKAEDQPGHEVIHVMATLRGSPVGIVLQQFDIQPVQPTGCADIERAFADLLDGRDPSQGQENAEVVRKIYVGASDRRIIRGYVFSLKEVAVGRQHKARFRPRGRRAGLQRRKRFRDLARLASGDVNVVCLKDAAQIGLVGFAFAQALDRGFLVAERFEEGERKPLRVKGTFCEG